MNDEDVTKGEDEGVTKGEDEGVAKGEDEGTAKGAHHSSKNMRPSNVQQAFWKGGDCSF